MKRYHPEWPASTHHTQPTAQEASGLQTKPNCLSYL
jgi:hypothetical protein